MGTRESSTIFQTTQLNPIIQPCPKPNQAPKERGSEKEPELRARLKLAGAGSGVKGREERHSTAPLTPLPTHTPHFCLDSEDVVRDVKSRTCGKRRKLHKSNRK